MLVLAGVPLYATIAVAAGGVDPLFGAPIPAWNPLAWNAEAFRYVLREIGSPNGVFFVPTMHTLAYAGIATFLCLVIGYPVAYCVARHGGKRRWLLLSLLMAPFFISYLMRMLAWVNLLRDDGMVNRFLQWLGILDVPYPWLSGKPVTVVLGLVYGYIPYMILPLFGGLAAVQPSIYEAARDLGSRPSEVFRRITWPLSRPAVIAATLIAGLPITGDYYTNDMLSHSPRTTMLANQVEFLLHTQNNGPTIGAVLILLMTVALIPPLIYYLRSSGGVTGDWTVEG
jgi:spermidine/putrescine transport system permease protein